MATVEDLARLEVFCSNEKCGDPVADKQGNIHYTKRRMNLVKTETFLGNKAIYKCPICMREKRFTLDSWTNEIRES